jgi:hypothetical protein
VLTRRCRIAAYTDPVTATIHTLTPSSDGIPQGSAEQLFDAARALSRMPPSMATSIEVAGIEGSTHLIAAAAERIAARFDLVATVKTMPLVAVRFARR